MTPDAVTTSPMCSGTRARPTFHPARVRKPIYGFQSLARDLRAWGVAAPIYVSVATRCDPIDARWSHDNPISRAQRKLAASGQGFSAGVNSDSLLDALDRYDGCHMAGSGLPKVID